MQLESAWVFLCAHVKAHWSVLQGIAIDACVHINFGSNQWRLMLVIVFMCMFMCLCPTYVSVCALIMCTNTHI